MEGGRKEEDRVGRVQHHAIYNVTVLSRYICLAACDVLVFLFLHWWTLSWELVPSSHWEKSESYDFWRESFSKNVLSAISWFPIHRHGWPDHGHRYSPLSPTASMTWSDGDIWEGNTSLFICGPTTEIWISHRQQRKEGSCFLIANTQDWPHSAMSLLTAARLEPRDLRR